VKHAIKEGDRAAFGQMILVGQFVILAKKFSVKKAVPDFAGVGQNGMAG
jgi:asparagine synthase (glutamine-hydrolysing)